jgi:carbamate kinase
LVHANRAVLEKQGWASVADGEGWRRVVASPAPIAILNLHAIRVLVNADISVICLGGGGIPVAIDGNGLAQGIEAVIDKDAASALLARDLGADALIMLTDVDGIMTGFGTTEAKLLARTTPKELLSMKFAPGTMGPKVAAAISMAKAGKIAMIGALGPIKELLAGTAGTWVEAD